MTYDFTTVCDRHDTNSVKWDLCPDTEVIPMWVADMDFKAAPFIMDTVRKRVEHGIFGYTHVPERYYDAVIGWFAKRRGWEIKREWIRYISGIVPALAVAVDALTEPGDKVVFQTPAYNCFFSCVKNNGREPLESPLIYDESGEQPTFRMDFDDLERKCSDPGAKLFILCNPQNPAGRVWTRDELIKVGEI
ncbi:MAG: aminotransferase class I/II-fold pyridoxal phosphate-dependent enzyme, partial [Bacteroidia bacterium]|nr:aminotransferase class I/II-fold pyridoxal phosphate-dependent enzyme [Bacteroidia bacterium]